jgi:uncharacterized lipoprotein YajG
MGKLFAAVALLFLASCAAPAPSQQVACYQWNPVEQAVANAVPWAPKSPSCAH